MWYGFLYDRTTRKDRKMNSQTSSFISLERKQNNLVVVFPKEGIAAASYVTSLIQINKTLSKPWLIVNQLQTSGSCL